MSICHFEEIGESQVGKIFETECGNEFEGQQPPTICPHCNKDVVLSPVCRRCSSTGHTTSWHDGALKNAPASLALDIAATTASDVIKAMAEPPVLDLSNRDAGIAAIIFLQKYAGIDEPPERAGKEWDRMRDRERRSTLDWYQRLKPTEKAS